MLINSNFSKLVIAYFCSIFGDWALKLVIPIYIYNITQSPLLMASAYAVGFLPYIIIMPLAGACVDVVNRCKLLYISDFIAVLLAILIFISMFLPNNISLYMLFPLLFINATIVAIQHPASQAFIPEIVSSQHLAKANSYMISIMHLSNIIAPFLCGLLISAVGLHATLGVNLIGFLLSGILIFFIKYEYMQPHIDNKLNIKSIMSSLKEGVIFTFSNPIVKWATIIFTIVNLSTQLIQSNMMYILINNLNVQESSVGIIFGFQGLAAILGALFAPKVYAFISQGRLILLCILIDAFAILMHMYAYDMLSIIIVRMISTFSESIIVVSMFTLRHEVVPNNMLGKVIGISRPISFISIPLAAFWGSYLLKISFSSLILWATLVMIVSIILGIFSVFNSPQHKLNQYKTALDNE